MSSTQKSKALAANAARKLDLSPNAGDKQWFPWRKSISLPVCISPASWEDHTESCMRTAMCYLKTKVLPRLQPSSPSEAPTLHQLRASANPAPAHPLPTPRPLSIFIKDSDTRSVHFNIHSNY